MAERKNTERIGRMRRMKNRRKARNGHPSLWKRVAAASLAAVTLLTGMNYEGLESVFAQEKSGYSIDVNYSEDKSQAILTGNSDSLKPGVDLVSVTDTAGTEYDPTQFSYPVTENGEYTFTLDYQVQEETRTRDIKEELKVTVDGIQKAETEETQAAVETQTADQQTTEDSTSDTTAAADQEAPATVALSVLQQSLAEARSISTTAAQIEVKQYAAESVTVNLEEGSNKHYFTGGSLIDGDTDAVPDYPGTPAREFARAAFVYPNVPDNMVELTGLYPLYNGDTKTYDWYYTTKTTDESSGSEGSDSVEDTKVGFLLPDGVEVRFYYALTESTIHTLTVSASEDFKVEIAGVDSNPSNNSYQVQAGARVVVTATLDSGWWWAIARLASPDAKFWADYSLERKEYPAADAEGDTVPASKAELLSTDTSRYRFTFTMPSGATSLEMRGKSYEDDEDGVIWFGVGSTENNSFQQSEIGATRFYTVSKTSNANTTDTPARLSYNRASLPADNGGFGTYVTGAKPYMVKEGYFNSSDNYAAHASRVEYRGNTTGNASDNISGANVSDKAVSTVYDRALDNSKVGVAVGELVPGGTAKLRLEASRGGWGENYTRWVYAPMTVDLDVYQNGGEYSSKNFSRYTFRLPISVNDKVEADIPGGGHITITCAYANVAEANATDAWGTEIKGFGNGGGYSSNNWFAYDITVSGILTDWKIIYNSVSTAQTTVYTNITGGVIEGSGNYQGYGTAYTMSRDLSGSWVRYRKSGQTAGYYYPLSSGEDFWKGLNELTGGAGGTSPGISFGLSVREGYSRPSFTRSPANLASVQYNGYVQEGGYNPKRYKYTVTFNLGSVKNTISGPSVVLNIDSQPVNYAVQYYHNGKAYETPQVDGTDVSLAYDKVENYIIQPELPDSTMNLKGYQLQICDSNGKEVQKINYNNIYSGSQTLWMPGNMLDVRKIYQYMRDQNKLAAGETDYTIRLIPQPANTGESVWLVNGIGFTAYQQTDWFSLNETGKYEDSLGAFADNKTYYRDGYSDSAVVFGNYPEVLTTEKGTYLLDEDRSTLSGRIGAVQAIVGKFYYVNATKVTIKMPSDVENATEFSAAAEQITAWNGTHGNTWYTGTNGGPNQTVDLSGIDLPNEITIDGQKYNKVGWRIARDADGALDSADNLYNYEVSDSLDLYTLGTNEGDTAAAGRDAWNAVFGSGSGDARTKGSAMLTLVPYYEAATRPITLEAGANRTGEMGERTLYVNADGSHNHTLKSTFYMEEEALTDDATANYAVYTRSTEASRTLWGKTETGKINLKTGGISDQVKGQYHGFTETGQTQVTVDTDSVDGYSMYTLTISGIKANPGGSGRQYRIYVWNEGNGLPDSFTPDKIYEASGTGDDALAQATRALDNAFGNTSDSTATGAARDWYELKMIYPFTPVQVSDPNATGAYTDAYTAGQQRVTTQTGGDENGTVTLEATYYYTGEWTDYAGEKMSIALYRDGKNSAGEGSVTDRFLSTTIDLPKLEKGVAQEIALGTAASTNMESKVWITLNNDPEDSSGSITVKFKLLNGNNNRLQYLYEDATSPSERVWRLYAWNKSNANGDLSNIDTTPSTGAGQTDPLPTPVPSSGAKVAQVDSKIHIIPKAVASTSSVMHVEAADPTRAKTGTNFLVTATFQLDQNYPYDLQLGKPGAVGDTEDKEDGKMHTTIMKLNPNGADTEWKTWMYDNTVTSSGQASGGSPKVEIESVTEDITNSRVTITYRLIDVSGSITRQYEEGAKYEILAWNYTNAPALKTNGISQETLNAQFSHSGGTSYGTVPSVIHTVSMVAPEMESMSVTQDTFDVHTGGDSSGTETAGVDIEAKFRYKPEGDDFTWDTMKQTLKFALYRHVERGNDAGDTKWADISYSGGRWVLNRISGTAGQKLSTNVTVSEPVTENGYQVVTITMRILNKEQNGPSIRYAWEDSNANMGTEYRVYAWSEGNEYQKAGTGEGNAANDLELKPITAETKTPPATNAEFTAKLNVLPTAILSCQKQDNVSEGNTSSGLAEGIFHQRLWNTEVEDTDGDGFVDITAQFDGDVYYPENLQTGDGATEDAKIHTALYVKDNTDPDSAWTLWETDGKASNDGTQYGSGAGSAVTPVIDIVEEQVNGQKYAHIQVTYKISDEYFVSANHTDVDFCIAIWNETNVNPDADPNTGAGSGNDFDPGDSTAPYTSIPSVTNHMLVGWTDPGIYVTVPKYVTLSERNANVAGKTIGETYAGNSVTISLKDNFNGMGTNADNEAIVVEKIRVHILNSIPLIYSPTRDQITAETYDSNGTKLSPVSDGHIEVGTFNVAQGETEVRSITFWLNADLTGRTLQHGVEYSGNMTFMFTNMSDSNSEETGGNAEGGGGSAESGEVIP